MCPGLDLSEPKRRWLSWGQGLRPTSRSLEFEGGNESAKHNFVLSGTKERRSWAALVWHLGAQEQVGTAVVSYRPWAADGARASSMPWLL